MEDLVKTEIEYFTLDTNEGNNLSDETLIKQEEGLDVDFHCVFCDAILTDRESLSDHIETDHKLNFKITNIETVPSVDTPQNPISVTYEKITCRYCNEVLSNATFLAHIESSCSGMSYFRESATSKIRGRRYYISCQVCDMHFSGLKSVRRLINHCIQEHNLKQEKVKPYPCAACPNRFRSPCGLIGHHKNIHTESHAKCSFCNTYLRTESELKEHYCPQDSSRRYSIKRRSKPKVDTVKLSTEEGATKGPKITNIETVPSDATPQNPISVTYEKITCRYCNEVLSNATFLAHIESSCSGISYFRESATSQIRCRHHYISCQVCDMHFSGRQSVINLIKHCIQEHNLKKEKVKPYPCAACPNRFRTSESLSKHHRNIHAKSRVKCSFCNRYLRTESELKEHYCPQYPLTKFSITTKLSTEGGATIGPSKKYKCQECGAAFAMWENRKRHIEFKHLKAEPLIESYFCEKCEEDFYSPWALAVHQVKHMTKATKTEKFGVLS